MDGYLGFVAKASPCSEMVTMWPSQTSGFLWSQESQYFIQHLRMKGANVIIFILNNKLLGLK